ncbi:MAG: hypothetical protein ACRDOO_09530 [Actinomadura sp.]
MDETHTDARAHLERLSAELTDRGWHADVVVDDGRPTLAVGNPRVKDLNDRVAYSSEAFRWTWGQGIGPVTDIPGVADRIVHVLREVPE